MVVEPERLEMLEQFGPQVVDHPLSGIHLYLGAVGRHELIHDLEQHAGGDDDDEHRDHPPAGDRIHPAANRFRKRMRGVVQDVVDDDFERPGLQRTEPDFSQQQYRQERQPSPVRPQIRKDPRTQSPTRFGAGGGGAAGGRTGARATVSA